MRNSLMSAMMILGLFILPANVGAVDTNAAGEGQVFEFEYDRSKTLPELGSIPTEKPAPKAFLTPAKQLPPPVAEDHRDDEKMLESLFMMPTDDDPAAAVKTPAPAAAMPPPLPGTARPVPAPAAQAKAPKPASLPVLLKAVVPRSLAQQRWEAAQNNWRPVGPKLYYQSEPSMVNGRLLYSLEAWPTKVLSSR